MISRRYTITSDYTDAPTVTTIILAQAKFKPTMPTPDKIKTRAPLVLVDDLNSSKIPLRFFIGV
jgi:hypothetical protein